MKFLKKFNLFSKKTFGNIGEDIAESFLISAGYKVIERNYNSKQGEIDIIAVSNDILVFIEVKTRSSTLFGLPEEAVTAKKQQHISKTAKYYLTKSKKYNNFCYRADIISILLSKDNTPIINHFIDAFPLL